MVPIDWPTLVWRLFGLHARWCGRQRFFYLAGFSGDAMAQLSTHTLDRYSDHDLILYEENGRGLPTVPVFNLLAIGCAGKGGGGGPSPGVEN
jgi:hypothetical protein